MYYPPGNTLNFNIANPSYIAPVGYINDFLPLQLVESIRSIQRNRPPIIIYVPFEAIIAAFVKNITLAR